MDHASAHAARALERLVDIELDVADALRRMAIAGAQQVEAGSWSAGGPLAGVGELGLSLERVARAIRRTVILQRRLADDDIAKAEKRRAQRAEHKARIQARKDQISGTMVDAIDVPGRGEAEIGRLYAELDRWVEEHQYDEDFTDIRVDVLLKQAAKHLGLEIELDEAFYNGVGYWSVVRPNDPDPDDDEHDEAPAIGRFSSS